MQVRAHLTAYSMIVAVLILTGCAKCTEQHDPTYDRALFKREGDHANAVQPKLTAEGKIPVPVVPGQVAVDPGTAKFNQFCSPCHGMEGRADGAAAAALTPKPRDFTDAKWQASVDDARIATVIKNGGAAVGLSANMAAWGGVLNDDDIKLVVAKVREFAKK